MAINRHTTEITEPRVNLGTRKANDKVFGIIFILGCIAHVVLSIILITSSNAYVPVPRTLYPDSCTSGCYFSSYNCPVGLVKVIDFAANFTSTEECVNPCDDDYIFLQESHDCVKKSSIDLAVVEECHDISRIRRRRSLQENIQEEQLSFSDVLADAAFVIIGLLVLIFAVACTWGYLLQKYSVKMVWTTIGIEIIASVTMCIYLFTESSEAALANLLFTVVGIAFFIRYRKKVTTSAQLLGQACAALRAHPSVFAYGVLIKGFWVLYTFFTFHAVFESFLIQDIKIYRNEDFDDFTYCNVLRPEWIGSSYTFLFLMLGWITSFLHQIRWGTVGGTVCLWFFHTGTEDMPENPPALAIKWATTTSFGTHAFSALVIQVIERLRRFYQNKCLVIFSGPIGWVIYCILGCLQGILTAMTKYATVLHVLTSEGLYRSAKRTFAIMKRHFTQGIVTATVGESVLRVAATILAFCVTWVSFLSLLSVHGRLLDTILLRNGVEIAMVFVFLFTSFFPVFTAFVVLLIFVASGGAAEFQTDGSILMIAIVIGIFTNLLLRYIGDIINDALSAVFVCYAVAKDNDAINGPQAVELERLIDVVLTDSLLPANEQPVLATAVPPQAVP